MLWDTIVVGAGIEGSATAYSLAKQGHKTLLLEQFPLPHSRGSSHGQSRITRLSYDQPYYTAMMADAFKLWLELERESSTKLYIKTGLLTVAKAGSPLITRTASALKSIGATGEHLSGKALLSRFPMVEFDSSFEALFDSSGGILLADKCLRAFQSQFVKYGGVLQDTEPVLQVDSDGNVAHVKTKKSDYKAKSVIITAGPWTSRFTEPLGLQLPLKSVRIAVWFWKQLAPNAYGSIERGSPVLMYFDDSGGEVWGLPSCEYPDLAKVAYHNGPVCDPDNRDAVVDDSTYVRYVSNFVRKHLPGLDCKPSITETCIYTWTPDEDPILDMHPKWKNIVIGAGFSGHGFKLAPVVGKILAELAVKQKASYNVEPFRMARFASADDKKFSAKL